MMLDSCQIFESVAILDLLADLSDDREHHLHVQAEDDHFRMAEGMVQADGVAELRTLVAGTDAEDVPAVFPDIGQQLPLGVVLGDRQGAVMSSRCVSVRNAGISRHGWVPPTPRGMAAAGRGTADPIVRAPLPSFPGVWRSSRMS